MKIVAVTGGIGAGKSTVSKLFAVLGANVISADDISHRIMDKGSKAYDEVVECFGNSLLDNNGEIDRKALANIVFNEKDKLDRLNSITHKYIYAEIRDEISENFDVNCVEIPLLFSADCPLDIDVSIAVIADMDVRIARIINRDRCSAEDAIRRINNQISDDELRRLADVVIENNGDEASLKAKVFEIFSGLESSCGTERI